MIYKKEDISLRLVIKYSYHVLCLCIDRAVKGFLKQARQVQTNSSKNSEI